MRVCSQCGTPPEPQARFCKDCGHSLPAEPEAERPVAPQGRQMNVAGGNIEQNVINEHNVTVGAIHMHAPQRSHLDNLAEYQRTFRGIVEGLRTFNRDWLSPEESQQLELHAGRLGLAGWERQDGERTVLERLGMVLQAPPREFWSIAVGSNKLAEQLTGPEATKAAAAHLDREDPSRMLVWNTDMMAWQKLPQVPTFQAAVMAERLARFQSLLGEWARRGQPSATIPTLRDAARHLSNHDIQSARRFVSSATGRPITIPPDIGIPATTVVTAIEAPLEGTWEAETNPSVRVVLAERSVRLKTTYPVVRQVDAVVVGRHRVGDDFTLELDIVGGDFKALRSIGGKVRTERLSVELIKGADEPGIRSFQTSYRRV